MTNESQVLNKEAYLLFYQKRAKLTDLAPGKETVGK